MVMILQCFVTTNYFNTPRPRQNGLYFLDNIICDGCCCILIQVSPGFAPGNLIDNVSTLVRVMAWLWAGCNPLMEAMNHWWPQKFKWSHSQFDTTFYNGNNYCDILMTMTWIHAMDVPKYVFWDFLFCFVYTKSFNEVVSYIYSIYSYPSGLFYWSRAIT